jgi:hypothetical protein
MEVLRFDFNGSSDEFKRTPQGFLRVNARLSKTGVFKYADQREYRSDEEVFCADSLDSLKGAPVTDLHPAEKGCENFLTPANVKEHIIGITEGVERDGPYLKGSLIIFHEDAIKAIESGERKEISLGYKCRVEPTPGVVNGEAYDAIQRAIIVNHVAIGPKGWGRAGPDCSIRTDTKNYNPNKGQKMDEIIRLDGVDITLNADSIKTLFKEKQKQLSEMQGRLDAANQEIEKKNALIVALEEPKAISERINARIKLITQCTDIVGDTEGLDSLSNEEIKQVVIKKHYPKTDFKDKDQNYIEGMFEALLAAKDVRCDSLANTRTALVKNASKSLPNAAYEKWLSHSANLWSVPLAGSAQGGR